MLQVLSVLQLQQIDALFESGTYAEVGYTHMSLDVTGTDASGHSISNMAEDFQLLNYAVKTDLSPFTSCSDL